MAPKIFYANGKEWEYCACKCHSGQLDQAVAVAHICSCQPCPYCYRKIRGDLKYHIAGVHACSCPHCHERTEILGLHPLIDIDGHFRLGTRVQVFRCKGTCRIPIIENGQSLNLPLDFVLWERQIRLVRVHQLQFALAGKVGAPTAEPAQSAESATSPTPVESQVSGGAGDHVENLRGSD